MNLDPTDILREAMKLPPEARAALAGSLIESLEGPIDEGAEAAWATEIARRVQELESGAVKAVPWVAARRQIAGE